jgi:hypothetical protein
LRGGSGFVAAILFSCEAMDAGAKNDSDTIIVNMYSSYTLNTSELTPHFISALKEAYPNQEIKIAVQEVRDETEFLLKDTQLLKAVEDARNGENLVSVPFEALGRL